MGIASFERRLERLEAPKNPRGACLFLCSSAYEPSTWKGTCGGVYREWHRRDGESAQEFHDRVEREARPLGVVLLTGFDEEAEKNVSA